LEEKNNDNKNNNNFKFNNKKKKNKKKNNNDFKKYPGNYVLVDINNIPIPNECITSIGNPNYLDKIRYLIFQIPDKIIFKLEVQRGNDPERRFTFDYKNYLDTQIFPDIRMIIIEKKKNDNNSILVESEKKIKEDFKKRSTIFSTFNFPKLLMELEMILNELRAPGMFKYNTDDVLTINDEMSKRCTHIIWSSFDKIIISPDVVENNEGIKYEGVKLVLYDDIGGQHICKLTYEELFSLHWNLKQIDITGMALDIYLRMIFKPVNNNHRR